MAKSQGALSWVESSGIARNSASGAGLRGARESEQPPMPPPFLRLKDSVVLSHACLLLASEVQALSSLPVEVLSEPGQVSSELLVSP